MIEKMGDRDTSMGLATSINSIQNEETMSAVITYDINVADQ